MQAFVLEGIFIKAMENPQYGEIVHRAILAKRQGRLQPKHVVILDAIIKLADECGCLALSGAEIARWAGQDRGQVNAAIRSLERAGFLEIGCVEGSKKRIIKVAFAPQERGSAPHTSTEAIDGPSLSLMGDDEALSFYEPAHWFDLLDWAGVKGSHLIALTSEEAVRLYKVMDAIGCKSVDPESLQTFARRENGLTTALDVMFLWAEGVPILKPEYMKKALHC